MCVIKLSQAFYISLVTLIVLNSIFILTGQCVATAEKKQVALRELSLVDLKNISSIFESDVSLVWNYENSVEQYTSVGGTSKKAVLQQIETMETALQQ